MRRFFIKDSEGKPSVTTTAFVLGFILVNVKLVLSEIAFNETIKFSQFGGGDYAAALAALGAVYVLRKHSQTNSQTKKEGE